MGVIKNSFLTLCKILCWIYYLKSGSVTSTSTGRQRYRAGFGSSYSSGSSSSQQTPKPGSAISRTPGSRRTPNTCSSTTPALATPSVNECTALVGESGTIDLRNFYLAWL